MATVLEEHSALAELEEEKSSLVAWAKSFQVTTAQEFEIAAERCKDVKAASKRVDEFFDPLIRQADQTTKDIRARKRIFSEPLNQTEGLLKQLMLNYQQAEERKAAEEQRRLQAEADEQARREREALAKRAADAKRPSTREKYQEAAASVVAPVVHVPTATPKVSGIATRKIWKARVVNACQVPREFLCVDEKKLDAYAKAMKEGAKVPGVEFFVQEVLAAGGR